MENKFSAFDIFNAVSESLSDAKQKQKDESKKQSAQHFRINKDGKYELRVMPIAPDFDKDGNPVITRKGYEYPTKELVLKINTPKGETFVSVSHAKYVLKDLDEDLIDAYVRVACEMYADDAALIKTIRSNSFSGGLKYDSKRCMYVLNLKEREAGLQLYSLSYAQYKDLEDRKIEVWERFGSNAFCPLCSPTDAYPLLINRETENRKVKYRINLDTIDKVPLTEDELKALIDAPRLPEVIYRFSRYHLEAEIAYLKQYDEIHGLKVMDSEDINAAIEKIKMLLPAEDNSHFSISGGSKDGKPNSLEDLMSVYEEMRADDLDDKSEEGQDLRAAIKEYIEEKDYPIVISRSKLNKDLLDEIAVLESDDSVPMAEAEDSKKRNDDTAEPAARSRRR